MPDALDFVVDRGDENQFVEMLPQLMDFMDPLAILELLEGGSEIVETDVYLDMYYQSLTTIKPTSKRRSE